MRYLIYSGDRHEVDCHFADEVRTNELHDADAGLTVIVDLELGLRRRAGQWLPVFVRKSRTDGDRMMCDGGPCPCTPLTGCQGFPA